MTQIVQPYNRTPSVLLGTDTDAQVRAALSVYDTETIDDLLAAIELTPGPTGATGATGATGPNTVTTATTTNLTGILTGNGTVVGSTASLSLAQGGTGGTSAATARTALDVDSKAEVTTKANTAATNTFHDTRYRTQTELATGVLSLANKTLPNSIFPNDLSFDQSLYTKNQLCNCVLNPSGGLTATLDGSPFALTTTEKLSLVNSRNDYENIALPGQPTSMTFTFDHGSILSTGYSAWQPFFSMRYPFNTATRTRPIAIQVQVSLDGTTWAEPTGNAWINTNLAALGNENCWVATSAAPQISGSVLFSFRYIKFTLTNWHYDPGYASRNVLWIYQFGIRNIESPPHPQYVRKAGDDLLGDFRFRGAILDQNGSKGTNTQLLSSDGTKTLWVDAPTGESDPITPPYHMEVALSYGDDDVTAGAKKELIYVHTSGDITDFRIICDPANEPIAGDIEVDLNTVDSGTGAATSVLSSVATIVTETSSGIGTVDGTQSVTAGDLLSIDVDSGSDGKRLRAIIKITPTT